VGGTDETAMTLPYVKLETDISFQPDGSSCAHCRAAGPAADICGNYLPARFWQKAGALSIIGVYPPDCRTITLLRWHLYRILSDHLHQSQRVDRCSRVYIVVEINKPLYPLTSATAQVLSPGFEFSISVVMCRPAF
jgi:hypothetical protein